MEINDWLWFTGLIISVPSYVAGNTDDFMVVFGMFLIILSLIFLIFGKSKNKDITK